MILKRKRARAYVAKAQRLATSRGKLQRLRKLRVIRRTRFNSRVQVLDAFLLNAVLMRKVLAADAFVATMKAGSVKKQKKLDEAVKAWGQDAVYHRARRALIIGGPCAVLALANPTPCVITVSQFKDGTCSSQIRVRPRS